MFNNPKAITLTFSSLYPMGGLPLEPSVSTITKESKKWFLSPFILFLCHERIPTQRALFVTPWLPYTHHHFLQSVFILYLFFAFFLWGWKGTLKVPCYWHCHQGDFSFKGLNIQYHLQTVTTSGNLMKDVANTHIWIHLCFSPVKAINSLY